MADDSESDMETVELSDVDADVTAEAVADQVMVDADPVLDTERADNDYPSPPPSPDQSRRHSMAARMAATKESRLKKTRDDVNDAKRREEEHRKEDLKRRQALEASAKRYQTSLKSGKRKSSVPVKRKTQVIDDSDEDVGTQLAQSRKLTSEPTIRQSPMRKAKLKSNGAEASSQQKDISTSDLPQPRPSPARKVKKKVTRKKKVLPVPDVDDDSVPAEDTTAPRNSTKTPASEKRTQTAKRTTVSKTAPEPDDDVSAPSEDHSSDEAPPHRRGRQAPGSKINAPGNTRSLGSPKSTAKLSGAARIARDNKLRRDREMDRGAEIAEESQNGRQDTQLPEKQNAIEDKRQAAIEEAEKLRREQEQWRKKTREDRRRREEEKRMREEEDRRYRLYPVQPAPQVTHMEERLDDAVEDGVQEEDKPGNLADEDEDDDDDVILVSTLHRGNRSAPKGYIPVSSPKDLDSEASKKKRGRPRKTLEDQGEPSKRRKVGDNEGEAKSKRSGPSSKSAAVAKSVRGKKASAATTNESGKVGQASSRMEVETNAPSPLMAGEHDKEMKEIGNDDKVVSSPRKATSRTTRVVRKPASTRSDAAGKRTRKGNASAQERSAVATVQSPDQGHSEHGVPPDAAKKGGDSNEPDAPLAAAVSSATPATAQRGRSRVKRVSRPISKSTPVGSKDQANMPRGQDPISLPAEGEKSGPASGKGLFDGQGSQIYVSEQEEASVIKQLVYSLETLDLQHVDLQEDLFTKLLGKLAQRPGLGRSTSLMEVDGEGMSRGVRQTRRRRELLRNIEAAKVAFQDAQQKALVTFVKAVSTSLENAREKGGGALGDMIGSNGHGALRGVLGIESDAQEPVARSTAINVGNNKTVKGGKAAASSGKSSAKVKMAAKGSSRQGKSQSGSGEGSRDGQAKKTDAGGAESRAAALLPVFKSMPEVRSFVGDKYSSLNLNCMRSQAILTLCERDGGVGRSELCEALPFSARVFDTKISELKNLGFINEWRSGEGTDGSVMYSTVTIAD